MKDVKLIKFSGALEVTGIFNFNRTVEIKDQEGKKRNNHTAAKKITIKTPNSSEATEIDYTSSRCIRHELFKDLAPRQPTTKEFEENFLQIAGSELGLLRGYLNINGPKRASPISIQDAFTTAILVGDKEIPVTPGTSTILYDQGSSSKPKEGKTVSEVEGKSGKSQEVKSDTSIFSKDNAPRRLQRIEGAINIRQLQFLELEPDSDFRVVFEEQVDEYLTLLRENLGADGIIRKKYAIKSALDKHVWDGILLPDKAINKLVSSFVNRLYFLESYKTGASLKTYKDGFKVEFITTSGAVQMTNFKEVIDALEKNQISYYKFYDEV